MAHNNIRTSDRFALEKGTHCFFFIERFERSAGVFYTEYLKKRVSNRRLFSHAPVDILDMKYTLTNNLFLVLLWINNLYSQIKINLHTYKYRRLLLRHFLICKTIFPFHFFIYSLVIFFSFAYCFLYTCILLLIVYVVAIYK